jgi:hypothetical protein
MENENTQQNLSTNDIGDKKEIFREHAWKYFQLHASQRMTLFNFYITICTAIVAGIGVFMNFDNVPFILIITLGILMIVFSIVFWLLDERTRYFIHLSERVIMEIESNYSNEKFRIVTIQENESRKISFIFRYSFALRAIFILFVILGIVSIIYTINNMPCH